MDKLLSADIDQLVCAFDGLFNHPGRDLINLSYNGLEKLDFGSKVECPVALLMSPLLVSKASSAVCNENGKLEAVQLASIRLVYWANTLVIVTVNIARDAATLVSSTNVVVFSAVPAVATASYRIPCGMAG